VVWFGIIPEHDHETPLHNIGLEVLAAVVVKNSIFWDVTPYIQLKIN
jgi:hypothetical protein